MVKPNPVIAKRKEHLSKTEDEVYNRVIVEPWNTQLADLVIYKTMHAKGIRISEIDKLIADALKRAVPA